MYSAMGLPSNVVGVSFFICKTSSSLLNSFVRAICEAKNTTLLAYWHLPAMGAIVLLFYSLPRMGMVTVAPVFLNLGFQLLVMVLVWV